tara:strand:+ start:2290 stop:2667 length:378 start_codon:yes stop_codon:yes gene_type:complete
METTLAVPADGHRYLSDWNNFRMWYSSLFLVVGLLIGIPAGMFVSRWDSAGAGEKASDFQFGIRMTRDTGVKIFGVDEIQSRLENGAVITSLQCRGANFVKTGSDSENTSLAFSGGTFDVRVVEN